MVRNLLILILLATNVGCDQISKSIVRQTIDYDHRTSVIGSFVTITKVENTGAFLGLGDQLPRIIYKILMIILPLIVLGYALYYLLTSNNLSKLLIIGICLVIGGGLGNVYDRIIYGSVTDFLHFDFVLFQTGIVNMADISITIGFFILVFEFFNNGWTLNLKSSEK
ncbi:MAG: signal peptidase II [Bacteroidales bacterium]|nr:signal peptidase II [Bacteroidales bacterium]